MIPEYYTIAPSPVGQFKSTLESKWFDEFWDRGLNPLYEPASFDVSPWASKYTPDFLITLPWPYCGDVWVEIKPAGIELVDEWCLKAYGLQRFCERRAIENEEANRPVVFPSSVIFIQGPPVSYWTSWMLYEGRKTDMWEIGAAGEQISDALGVPLRDWATDEVREPRLRRAQLAEEFFNVA